MKKPNVLKWIAMAVVVTFTTTSATGTPTIDLGAPASTVRGPSHFVNPEHLSISSEYGSIEERFIPESAGRTPDGVPQVPLVVHIQDAHAIYEAQLHIREILNTLQTQHGLAYVGFEGGQGEAQSAVLRLMPDEAVKQRVLKAYAKRGELSGVGLASVLNPEGFFFGLENLDLYEKNRMAFLDADRERGPWMDKLTRVWKILERLEKRIDSPRLTHLKQAHRLWRLTKKDILEFVEKLTAVRPFEAADGEEFPHLAKLMRILERERSLDRSAVAMQKEKLLVWVERQGVHLLSNTQRDLMLGKLRSYREGKLDERELFEALFAGLSAADPGLAKMRERHPDFFAYWDESLELAAIKGGRLFDEVEAYVGVVKEGIYENQDERDIDLLVDHLEILQNMARLEMTRQEWDRFLAQPDAFTGAFFRDKLLYLGLDGKDDDAFLLNWERESKPAQEFYRLAVERDRVMLRHFVATLKKRGEKLAAIVTGGFHTEGLRDLLEQEGLAYLVVAPRISNVNAPSPYLRVIKEENLSWHKWRKVKASTLAAWLPLTGRVSNEFIGAAVAVSTGFLSPERIGQWQRLIAENPRARPFLPAFFEVMQRYRLEKRRTLSAAELNTEINRKAEELVSSIWKLFGRSTALQRKRLALFSRALNQLRGERPGEERLTLENFSRLINIFIKHPIVAQASLRSEVDGFVRQALREPLAVGPATTISLHESLAKLQAQAEQELQVQLAEGRAGPGVRPLLPAQGLLTAVADRVAKDELAFMRIAFGHAGWAGATAVSTRAARELAVSARNSSTRAPGTSPDDDDAGQFLEWLAEQEKAGPSVGGDMGVTPGRINDDGAPAVATVSEPAGDAASESGLPDDIQLRSEDDEPVAEARSAAGSRTPVHVTDEEAEPSSADPGSRADSRTPVTAAPSASRPGSAADSAVDDGTDDSAGAPAEEDDSSVAAPGRHPVAAGLNAAYPFESDRRKIPSGFFKKTRARVFVDDYNHVMRVAVIPDLERLEKPQRILVEILLGLFVFAPGILFGFWTLLGFASGAAAATAFAGFVIPLYMWGAVVVLLGMSVFLPFWTKIRDRIEKEIQLANKDAIPKVAEGENFGFDIEVEWLEGRDYRYQVLNEGDGAARGLRVALDDGTGGRWVVTQIRTFWKPDRSQIFTIVPEDTTSELIEGSAAPLPRALAPEPKPGTEVARVTTEEAEEEVTFVPDSKVFPSVPIEAWEDEEREAAAPRQTGTETVRVTTESGEVEEVTFTTDSRIRPSSPVDDEERGPALPKAGTDTVRVTTESGGVEEVTFITDSKTSLSSPPDEEGRDSAPPRLGNGKVPVPAVSRQRAEGEPPVSSQPGPPADEGVDLGKRESVDPTKLFPIPASRDATQPRQDAPPARPKPAFPSPLPERVVYVSLSDDDAVRVEQTGRDGRVRVKVTAKIEDKKTGVTKQVAGELYIGRVRISRARRWLYSKLPWGRRLLLRRLRGGIVLPWKLSPLEKAFAASHVTRVKRAQVGEEIAIFLTPGTRAELKLLLAKHEDAATDRVIQVYEQALLERDESPTGPTAQKEKRNKTGVQEVERPGSETAGERSFVYTFGAFDGGREGEFSFTETASGTLTQGYLHLPGSRIQVLVKDQQIEGLVAFLKGETPSSDFLLEDSLWMKNGTLKDSPYITLMRRQLADETLEFTDLIRDVYKSVGAAPSIDAPGGSIGVGYRFNEGNAWFAFAQSGEGRNIKKTNGVLSIGGEGKIHDADIDGLEGFFTGKTSDSHYPLRRYEKSGQDNPSTLVRTEGSDGVYQFALEPRTADSGTRVLRPTGTDGLASSREPKSRSRKSPAVGRRAPAAVGLSFAVETWLTALQTSPDGVTLEASAQAMLPVVGVSPEAPRSEDLIGALERFQDPKRVGETGEALLSVITTGAHEILLELTSDEVKQNTEAAAARIEQLQNVFPADEIARMVQQVRAIKALKELQFTIDTQQVQRQDQARREAEVAEAAGQAERAEMATLTGLFEQVGLANFTAGLWSQMGLGGTTGSSYTVQSSAGSISIIISAKDLPPPQVLSEILRLDEDINFLAVGRTPQEVDLASSVIAALGAEGIGRVRVKRDAGKLVDVWRKESRLSPAAIVSSVQENDPDFRGFYSVVDADLEGVEGPLAQALFTLAVVGAANVATTLRNQWEDAESVRQALARTGLSDVFIVNAKGGISVARQAVTRLLTELAAQQASRKQASVRA